MVSQNLEKILFEELNYDESPTLHQSYIWGERRPIPHIHGAYTIHGTPIAYFSQLSHADPKILWELHRNVWNESKAPLLYVFLPGEIRIYNTYAEPTASHDDFSINSGDRLLHHLQDLINEENTRQKIHQELYHTYDRTILDTGSFWKTQDGERIQRKYRADQRLLGSLSQLKDALILSDLSEYTSYALIGRSIFICYLQDRGILTRQRLLELTDGRSDDYISTLDDIHATKLLFERLSNKFNGDLFPLDNKESDEIRIYHLTLIQRFLLGEDLITKQTSFWPYNFNYIPIELISGIYDTFLKTEKRKKLGIYYSPLSLVDFVLEETLPDNLITDNLTILDPACGSGIFLVRAYQKIVNHISNMLRSKPNFNDLCYILENCIFGIDIEPNAIKIAIFSLYLSLLNFLDNNDIYSVNFKLPKLIDKNLFDKDFFSPEMQHFLIRKKFDRIIGNPPWGENTLTDFAKDVVRNNHYSISDNQISQAFLMILPTYCKNNGEIALIAPVRSTILGTSKTFNDFRAKFFQNFAVRAIVNFSALVYELFSDALSPCIAIFYNATIPNINSHIIYGVPKPSLLSYKVGSIVLDPTEIKSLSLRDLQDTPTLWKIALWGKPRDLALIERLKSHPTLAEIARDYQWFIGEGFQTGSGGEEIPDFLRELPFLPTNGFQAYSIDPRLLKPIEEHYIQWPRRKEIYQSPLVLIHQSRRMAALINYDVAYLASISGISGSLEQIHLFKWLTAYINSSLVTYYLFLTSTRWAVERGNPLHKEYMELPFFIPPITNKYFQILLEYFDKIIEENDHDSNNMTEYKQSIDLLIYELFGISKKEQQLIEDLIQYDIDYFNWSKTKKRGARTSIAIQRPDIEMLKEYASSFIESSNQLLMYKDQALNGIVYHNGAPLTVVELEVVSASLTRELKIEYVHSLKPILEQLNTILLRNHSSGLYMRQHIRIYDGPRVYLVRPSERRFWTRSQAMADADSFLSEIIAHSKLS